MGMQEEYDFELQELDQEALDALVDFDEGIITLSTLRDLVGPEAAAAIEQQRAENDPDSFFDDPELM